MDTIPAVIRSVFAAVTEDLNKCFDLLTGAVNQELVDAIKALKVNITKIYTAPSVYNCFTAIVS